MSPDRAKCLNISSIAKAPKKLGRLEVADHGDAQRAWLGGVDVEIIHLRRFVLQARRIIVRNIGPADIQQIEDVAGQGQVLGQFTAEAQADQGDVRRALFVVEPSGPDLPKIAMTAKVGGPAADRGSGRSLPSRHSPRTQARSSPDAAGRRSFRCRSGPGTGRSPHPGRRA